MSFQLQIVVAHRIQQTIPKLWIRIFTKFLTNYNECFLYHCLNFGISFWIQWVRYYFRKNINEISTHASQFCFAIVRYFLQVWAWSHYIRSRVGNHFYGTEYEIWADFGLVGNTKKNLGPIMCNFWEQFFHVFRGKSFLKFFYKIL